MLAYHNGILYAIREFKQAGLSNDQLVTAVSTAITDKAIPTYVDPSAAAFIKELKRNGIAARKANNKVSDGIIATSGLPASGKLRISKDCPQLVKELLSYAWNKDTDKPLKKDDHLCDSLRYAVMGTVKTPTQYGVLRR